MQNFRVAHQIRYFWLLNVDSLHGRFKFQDQTRRLCLSIRLRADFNKLFEYIFWLRQQRKSAWDLPSRLRRLSNTWREAPAGKWLSFNGLKPQGTQIWSLYLWIAKLGQLVKKKSKWTAWDRRLHRIMGESSQAHARLEFYWSSWRSWNDIKKFLMPERFESYNCLSDH